MTKQDIAGSREHLPHIFAAWPGLAPNTASQDHWLTSALTWENRETPLGTLQAASVAKRFERKT